MIKKKNNSLKQQYSQQFIFTWIRYQFAVGPIVWILILWVSALVIRIIFQIDPTSEDFGSPIFGMIIASIITPFITSLIAFKRNNLTKVQKISLFLLLMFIAPAFITFTSVVDDGIENAKKANCKAKTQKYDSKITIESFEITEVDTDKNGLKDTLNVKLHINSLAEENLSGTTQISLKNKEGYGIARDSYSDNHKTTISKGRNTIERKIVLSNKFPDMQSATMQVYLINNTETNHGCYLLFDLFTEKEFSVNFDLNLYENNQW